jgi:HlyD family secretion protein
MKKKYLYLIIAVVVLGTAGYFYLSNSNADELTYRTEKISRGDVVVQVRATGIINPIQTVRVGSQVSGTVTKLFADFNSEVRKGQVIALIDTTFLAASVKEAEANLERNLAQVNEAKRTNARTTELFKKDLVSQADLDAAQTTLESSQAQLKQSQAALDRARVNLRYSVIHAPIDGVVISRDVDVGQTVAASLSAPQLFAIANDLKMMRVEASIDEADIGQIKTGQEVTFTVDSYPEEQFKGTVSQVRLAPVTVQNVVTYTVIIDVPNEDLKLRPGMTATVSILIDKREGVVRVPTLALRFQPPPELMEKMQKEKSSGDKSDSSQSSENKERRVERRMRDSVGGRGEMAGGGDGERRRMNTSGGGERRRMRPDGNNGEQRTRGGEMSQSKSGRSPMSRVWILENGRTLKSVPLRTGLNDNRYVEVLRSELKEGDEVVLGVVGPETSSMSNQQNNPFAPRMQSSSGGGGGRGRF